MQWSDVSAQWTFASIVSTTATVLIQLQSPAALNNLTADPPEDLTILRVVGDYLVRMTSGDGNWTLALLVADVTWTPGATISVDNDKRILWQKTYQVFGTAAEAVWHPPGMYKEAGGTTFPGDPSMTHIDISPKVKVEAGKALYLVAYENSGAEDLIVNSVTMRVLYKRSGRR